MFRVGNDLFLVGRTDPTSQFENFNFLEDILPAWLHHTIDLVRYSFRTHSNALWKVNKETGALEKILDIPGCGDTSFASIIRISKWKVLIANYTSPLK